MQRSYRPRQESAKIYVLKALFVPYSEANLLLSFKPGLFFHELEKKSRYKRQTLEKALAQAQRQRLIEIKAEKEANVIRLTEEGKELMRPFIAQKLASGARLMVIFDIPEDMSPTRAKFRGILRAWRFDQIQKSVWVTAYDHKQAVKDLVAELELDRYVILYECAPV